MSRLISPVHMEYVGGIKDLQGMTALVRSTNGGDFPLHTMDYSKLVMAQFDQKIVFNDKHLGLGWHPFPAKDFLTPKFGKKVF